MLVAGVKDTAPPFGFADPKSGDIVGYDVDLARALADRLGVKDEAKKEAAQRQKEIAAEHRREPPSARRTRRR